MNIYDQLKQLWARVTDLTKNGAAADTKIAALEAAAVRIQKDYSTTEIDTGLKWIDGKEIYSVAFTDTTPDETGTKTVKTLDNIDTVVTLDWLILSPNNNYYRPASSSIYVYAGKNGQITVEATSASFTSRPLVCICEYTKAAPSKSPDDEPETKATKAAKKKATK